MKEKTWLLKDCVDRDYHSWTSSKKIYYPDEVEDSWTGEDFYYKTAEGRSLNADEARRYLEGSRLDYLAEKGKYR